MSELRIEREFSENASKVFEFISKGENLAKWWGPEGMSLPEFELDFTQTGPWSSVMMNAEGQTFKVTGKVVGVDAPNWVEFTWAWHDDNDERGSESLVRFEVHAKGDDKALFILIHSGLADQESVENHNTGWSSSFNKLERL